MNLKNFSGEALIEAARKNFAWVLERELDCGVPLIYMDDAGQYVFRYKDGTILPASMEISFEENLENHRKIMGEGWTGI